MDIKFKEFIDKLLMAVQLQKSTLFYSTFNWQIRIYNTGDAELESMLCDPVSLAEVLPYMSTLGLDPTELSDALCGPELNITIQQIRSGINMHKVLSEVSELSWTKFPLHVVIVGYELSPNMR